MRVYLHIPAYTLGKDMPAREVPIDLPFPPFVGMQIGVCVGDGTPEAPGQSATVAVASVQVNHNWQMIKEPMPVEDSAMIEVQTSWVKRPGAKVYRGR